MNVPLHALEQDGRVTRPAPAPVGKVLPVRLTGPGQASPARASLARASTAVRAVEDRMLCELTAGNRAATARILAGMIRALREGES